MNQNYQIGDYLNLDGDEYPYRVIDVSNPTPFYGETYVMIENGCDDGLSPIKITPETLEAFGFKTEKENLYRLDTGIRKQYVVVFNIQDKWKCECGNMFGSIEDHPSVSENEVKIVVQNIHEIQHAMRVAGITKELEYKEK